MTDTNPPTTSLVSRRWRRIAGVLALAAMLTLAGCNGVLGGGNQQNNTSNSTVTPVDVPTDRPTATPAQQLVPGLTSGGITNGAALMRTQSEFLESHATVTRTNTSVIAANGSILTSIYQTNRQSESSDAVAFTTNYTGSTSARANITQSEGWSTDNGSYIRRTFKNGTVDYWHGPPNTLNGAGGLSASGLSTYLSAAEQGNVSVVTRQVNGSPRYLISGNFSGYNASTSYRLTIDEQGIIRDLLAIQPNYSGTGQKIRAHATIERTGNQTVEAPDWLSEARQQTRSTQTTNGATASTTHLGTSESEPAENATTTVTSQ